MNLQYAFHITVATSLMKPDPLLFILRAQIKSKVVCYDEMTEACALYPKCRTIVCRRIFQGISKTISWTVYLLAEHRNISIKTIEHFRIIVRELILCNERGILLRKCLKVGALFRTYTAQLILYTS